MAKKKAKKTFLMEVVIKTKKPEKLPDFGLGKGVLMQQEVTFTDDRGRGFKTPLFELAKMEHEERLMKETVEVRWTEKACPHCGKRSLAKHCGACQTDKRSMISPGG